MIKEQHFLGKWQFNYWIEVNESTILTIKENGVAVTQRGTRYKWEPLSNNGIHIFIDGYVDYIGFLRDGQISGHATSEYSMNEWTWSAIKWQGPIIKPIAKEEIENKIWNIVNHTDELDNFQASFNNNGSLGTTLGHKETWRIKNGELLFTFANGFITYTAKDVDNIIKGKAKNKACFEWDFQLEFVKTLCIKPKLLEVDNKLTNTTYSQYKEDKDIILKYLKDNNIECFYHFTDISNIPKIKEYGGLYSWDYIHKSGLNVEKQGGDELSKSLDKLHKLEDYVRVSFCQDHPMAYICKIKRNMNLVLLKIKIDVAILKDTRFSDMNATSSVHKQGPTLEDLKRVNIAATRKRYLKREDPDFAHHQAEVMVRRHIPIEYIINIDNPDRI